jgi:hypothetical protein
MSKANMGKKQETLSEKYKQKARVKAQMVGQMPSKRMPRNQTQYF